MTAVWRTSLVVTTAAVTAAALGGCQRSEATPPSISAPLHVVNHRPIVDAEVVSVDGKTHAMRLLIDTAADGVVVTAAFAKRAGLPVGKRVRRGDNVVAVTKLTAVRVGRKRLDLGSVEPQIALETASDDLAGVDGLVGAQVLRRYGRVTINFPAEQLTLGEATTAPVIGALVPATFDNGHVVGRLTLGNATHRLLLDTGSVTSHVRDAVPIRITGTRQGVWGRVVLAPFEAVSDPEELGSGIVGGNLLERFTLRFDYTRETLRISTT